MIFLKCKTNLSRLLSGYNFNSSKLSYRRIITSTSNKLERSKEAKCHYSDNYVFFWGGVFSQFYKASFVDNGVEYLTCEQFMMAEKARVMGDENTEKKILSSSNPADCKKLGRQILPWNPEKWDKNKYDIVYRGNKNKFTKNEDLKKILLSFGNRTFVEASPEDKIWGIGLGVDSDVDITNEANWKGQNLLGKVITQVRNEILEESNNQN